MMGIKWINNGMNEWMKTLKMKVMKEMKVQ